MARYYVNIAGLATDSELGAALEPLAEAIAAESTAREQAIAGLESRAYRVINWQGYRPGSYLCGPIRQLHFWQPLRPAINTAGRLDYFTNFGNTHLLGTFFEGYLVAHRGHSAPGWAPADAGSFRLRILARERLEPIAIGAGYFFGYNSGMPTTLAQAEASPYIGGEWSPFLTASAEEKIDFAQCRIPLRLGEPEISPHLHLQRSIGDGGIAVTLIPLGRDIYAIDGVPVFPTNLYA